jgi:hypothetical protein
MQLVDSVVPASGSAIIDGISEVHYTLDATSMSYSKTNVILLGTLFVVWASQIIYLWPAPPFVAIESVESLGGMDALWGFYLKWLGLVTLGFGGVFALYKRHRLWPAVVFLSSVLYLWVVHFPSYIANFFVGIESFQQIPGRLQLLGHGLSEMTLLHMQFVSPIFFVVAAAYAAISYVRSRRQHVASVSQSGI